jgi:O-antigen ligase
MTLAVGLGLLIADLSGDGSTTWRQSLRRWVNTLLGPKARVRICLALMVTGLILTQSRMGNAAFFSALMIAGIVGLIIFRRSSRSVILLFSSLIIIDTFLMGAFFGIDKLQQRIEQTDMSTDARVLGNKLALEFVTNMIWKGTDADAPGGTGTKQPPTAPGLQTEPNAAAQERSTVGSTEGGVAEGAIGNARNVDNPLPAFAMPTSTIFLGTGAGTYYAFFPLYRDVNVAGQNVHAHNDFFEFGLEFGGAGSLLLIGLVALTMFTAIKAQTSRHFRLMQAMGFAGMMAIFSLMIHSFTDFNLQIYANAVTYVAILALPFIAIASSRDSVTSPITR